MYVFTCISEKSQSRIRFRWIFIFIFSSLVFNAEWFEQNFTWVKIVSLYLSKNSFSSDWKCMTQLIPMSIKQTVQLCHHWPPHYYTATQIPLRIHTVFLETAARSLSVKFQSSFTLQISVVAHSAVHEVPWPCFLGLLPFGHLWASHPRVCTCGWRWSSPTHVPAHMHAWHTAVPVACSSLVLGSPWWTGHSDWSSLEQSPQHRPSRNTPGLHRHLGHCPWPARHGPATPHYGRHPLISSRRLCRTAENRSRLSWGTESIHLV